MKKKFIFGLIFFSFNIFAQHQKEDLKEFFNDFHKNPLEVMNQLPFKSRPIGTINPVEQKVLVRKKILLNAINKEDIFGINALSNLFYGSTDVVTNAFEIDEMPLKNVKLIEEPWSGYFWSMANGLIGYRYADKKFTRENSWQKRFEYVTANPSSSFPENKIELLSPAEKYDILIGAADSPITNFMWEEGKKEIVQFGKIREWSGLCHGLAMASLKFPWPKYSIKVKAADGKTLVKFYPEDIKSLGIFLWSGNISIRKLGGRCELLSPKPDSTGRVKDPHCRDPNPASFHLALINRLGIQKKSILMDSFGDAEVWNYPIVAYDFYYFNLETLKRSFKIKNAMIPLTDYKKDKFKEFRSPSAENIVGVEAKINYLTHGNPEHHERDPGNSSTSVTVLYRYDLEMDSDGKIIGGEWYTNKNPDFLWFPDDNADPRASFDYLIHSAWDTKNTPLPLDWLESANSSAERGQVSSNIIKSLFELSFKGMN